MSEADLKLVRSTSFEPSKLTFRLIDASMTASAASEGRTPLESEALRGAESKSSYLVEKRVVVSWQSIVDAEVGYDPRGNEPVVIVRFDRHGARRIAEITQANIGRRLAVVTANEVISTSVIREAIVDGAVQISARFTTKQARALARLLRNVMLLAPTIMLNQTVRPRGK
jgi:preprotein translocase subunit SecD